MNKLEHVSPAIAFPSDTCLHRLFEQQALRYPNATALALDGQSMSYGELNSRADILGQHLTQHGIQIEDFVVVYLERSFEMITAFFGILKAGAAYVPIDVNYPKERLAFMLEDAQAKVILTQSSLLETLPPTTAKIICLDQFFNQDLSALEVLPDISPFTVQSPIINHQSPATLAYMIYTSGSTGKPKGCMISHENLLNQLEGQQAIAPEPIGAMLLTCSISFDVSVLTIFWTLLQGAPLILPRQNEEKDIQKLSELIEKHQITHLLTLPSLHTLILEQAPPAKLQSIQLVNVSGEVCPVSLAQKHEKIIPNGQLYNLYGPTEAAVNCTFFKFPKGFSEAKAPIGKPILNYEIFILDEKMRPVKPGEVGEIYIGGTKPVVGRGYWNRPELTKERFVQKPSNLVHSSYLIPNTSHLYKTGDLARWQPDGNIEFLGRSDFQVKYRGYRIELGEVETAIGKHPGVKETVVMLKNQHEVNNQRLVAYLTLHTAYSLTVSDLRSFLEVNLPSYMLPSHFVFLEKMPLTTNGKFDRQALPEPPGDRPALSQSYEPPQGNLEIFIAKKWETLLQISPIGRHDKFFELGGNSIQAAKFIGELMSTFSTSIFITTIFDYPTVASYAAFFQQHYPGSSARISELCTDTVCVFSDVGAVTNRSLSCLSPDKIEAFPTLVPKRIQPSSINHKSSIINPLFILAPPRSGTTLLRVMLAGHPGLFACNELQLLHFQTLEERSRAYSGKFALWSEGLVRAVMELKNCSADEAKRLLHYLETQGTTTQQMFAHLQTWLDTLHNSYLTPHTSKRLVDKSPSYALDPAALEKAASDFEKPLFIHLVRHPYSMVRSFEKYKMEQVLWLQEHNLSARELGELVWLHSHRNTVEFLKKIPVSQQYRIVYEELVKNPAQVMRQLCDTLGIEFHEGLLQPYQDLDKKMVNGIHAASRSMGDTNFDQQVGINAAKADDWRGVLNDNFLCPETWELAQTFSYPMVESSSHKDGRCIEQAAKLDSRSVGMVCGMPPTHTVPTERQPNHDANSTNISSLPDEVSINDQSSIINQSIAIIGMACRLPGARNIKEFWQNLLTGKDVSHQVTDVDLETEGINHQSLVINQNHVRRTYALDAPYCFDATFFGFHPKEAEMLDPQHRQFLEVAYEALENAGCNPFNFEGKIGVFGGVARNTYLLNNLLTNKDLLGNSGGWYQEMLASESSFSVSRVAYKLNLRGPAVNVQTACSTGGVAVHLACQSLLSGDSEVVLVGGGRVQAPVFGGYQHIEGGPLSPDGYCRAFDAGANGMVQGHGMAMLVLKKLDNAIADGDHVWAVIKSTAINNDGSEKTGITAPSSKGQAACIAQALEKAGLTARHISYVEAHGTGTFIGDPIEIQGLSEGFGLESYQNQIAIGSVKTNIGHLDAGACIVGIIKTALSLHHEVLPPTLHWRTPNPCQGLGTNSPFFVNAAPLPWRRSGEARRAGVSSFGLGGTNAHIILEEAPVTFDSRQSSVGSESRAQLLVFSAKTEQALEQASTNLLGFFEENPGASLADAAFTLATGRQHFVKRAAFIAIPGKEKLEPVTHQSSIINHQSPITFLFPGGGAQYVNMTRDLYECNPTFRRYVEECFQILENQQDLNIREVVFPKTEIQNHKSEIEQPSLALASLFTIEYALAKLWQSWGVQPAEFIGHSAGEYAAACLAGVMSLEAAIGLVTVRGKLFETLPGNGGMLSVALTEEKLLPFLKQVQSPPTPKGEQEQVPPASKGEQEQVPPASKGEQEQEELTISVFNKIDNLVVSGTAAAIDRLQERLAQAGVECSKIHIKVAAHSPQIEPILPAFRKYLETVELRPPQIPIVSNVTGTWLTKAEATSIEYWLKHLRQPVRFANGLATLLSPASTSNPKFSGQVQQSTIKNRIFLEVGPGQTLSTFVRAVPTLEKPLMLASVRHPKEVKNDLEFILKSLARIWVSGVEVNWQGYFEGEKRRRIPLPTYPFDRKKFFIPPKPAVQPGDVLTAKTNVNGTAVNGTPIENFNENPSQCSGSSQLIAPNISHNCYVPAADVPPFGATLCNMVQTTPSRLSNLAAEIKLALQDLSGMEPADMDEQASFLELGFDSLFLSQAVIRFNQKFNLELSFRMLFEDTPSIAALAEYLDEMLPKDQFQPELPKPVHLPQSVHNQVNGDGAAHQNGQANGHLQSPIQPYQLSESLKLSESSQADSPLQQIIQQQLQIMQQQLALLGSIPFRVSGSAAFTPPLVKTATFQANGGVNAADPDTLKGILPVRDTSPSSTQEVEIQRKTKGVTAKLNSYKKINTADDLTEQQRQGLQNFIRRYEAMTQKSKDLAQRHRQWYADPRSVTGFSKLWKEICYQIAHDRSKGSQIRDIDGNEYVDYVMSYGVALFGHLPDFVEVAVTEALRRGNSIDLLPPEATDVARIICELTGFDRATLANTGTEAVLGAVRAARTATGRDRIAVFDTDYHGMIDQFLVRGVHLRGESKTLPSSPGVPKFLVENTLVLDYDDPEVFQKLEKNIRELAAVVIEPVQAQNPHWQHPELIRAIRQLTEKHGVALIFDEIINGFRLHQRGAQAWFGVEADICAYGKSISGGLPLAAVAGKAKFMDAFDGGKWQFGDDSSPEGVISYFASTFIKNPISVAAAHAALMEIQRRGEDLQADLNEKTYQFASRIREIFLRTQAPLMIQSASSFFMIKNADASPLTRLFNYFLRVRGVNIRERPCFISTAHTEADFEKTYQAFEDAIQDMFEAGLLEKWEGEDLNVVIQPPLLTQPSTLVQASEMAINEVKLTEGQQEIFLSDRFSPEASKAYNIATEIRLEGEHFDVEKMRKALQMLVNRHEALRTVFNEDGKTMRILPALEVEIPFVDLNEGGCGICTLEDLRHEEATHLFNLQNPPLVRFKILKASERVHLIIINVHHIICDGWSLGILTRELGEIYGKDFPDFKNLESLPQSKQLSQFAAEQADLQRLPQFQKNENYWLEQFKDGVPVLELPTDFPRPPVKTFNGAVEKMSFDPAFTAQLRKAAAKQGATFYVFMLAAFQAFLHRLTGQEDFVVGVAAAGHNLPGNQNLVGHAISLLPVRTKVDGGVTFGDYLKTVRKQVLDAFDHQQYTFGALLKKLKISRNASRNTLVSVAFNLDSPLDNLAFGDLKASTKAIPRHYETFDTFINLKPHPLPPEGGTGGVDFEWNFNTDLFRQNSIRLRLAEFEVFLRSICTAEPQFGGAPPNWGSAVQKLLLLPDFEQKQLEDFGLGEVVADFPLHRCLHELFEEQVQKTPDKTAVLFENQSLTYRELNDRAGTLAEVLLEKGLKPGAFVGLCMERSLDVLVSIYGILKAGAAYVPIDPRNPTERIRLILEDAECPVLLTQAGVWKTLSVKSPFQKFQTFGKVGSIQALVVEVEPPFRKFETFEKADSTPPLSPFSNDAYVIYTSGSTGTPKGVAIRHENAVNTLFAINKHLKISEKDTVFSVSSMAFDMSIPDYFLTLMCGATLILAGEETKKDGFALREALENHRPTVMQATPTTWKILLLAGWQGDQNLTAVAGGEGFPKELAAQMAGVCKSVWNGYGPTETTIYATYQLVTTEHLVACPGEFVAIGRAIANVETRILDKNGEPTPVGVPGELYIGGKGVAAGYLKRPELTTSQFVNLSIINHHSSFYRTGDLVRYLPDGEIEFLGRLDNQLKIRGFRVELGEIEETMKQFPGIQQSAVNVFTDPAGSQRLVGYVVENCAPLGDEWQGRLKDFLRSKMPGYMVPSVFMKLNELPMNTSLKIERKALPKPDLSNLGSGKFEAPKTPGEKLLADIWQELLGVERVGIHDDFFELGGHSLAAVSLMARIREASGKKLPLASLFQHSTIHKLAGQLNGFNGKHPAARVGSTSGHAETERVENQTFSSLISIREGGSKPPLYLVHGGGLHVLFYQNLVQHLDADQPIFALQAKGLNGDETPLDRIEDMAVHYLDEILRQNPAGVYCLAGYSLGGLIAWEMARQLKEAGKKVPMLALFDAVAKYEWAGEGSNGKWKKRLKKAGFNISLLLKNPSQTIEYKSNVLKMQLRHAKGKLLMAYRNNRTNEIEEGYLPYGKAVYEKSLEAYDRYELQPLDIQVDLFKAKEQMFYLHDPVHYGWDKFARGGVSVHEIEGNHLTLFDEPNGREVAKILEARLREIAMEKSVL